MSDKPLTGVETSTLLILMAEAQPVSNVSLEQDYRCYLKKPSREKLERLKLIEVERASGRLVLALSEKGWHHCRAQLVDGSPPPRSGSMGGALYAVLRRWERYLTAQRLSLSDFVAASNAPAVEALGEGSDEPAKEQAPGESDSEQIAGEPGVEESLRAAYRRIAPRVGELVSLADLRELVGDLARAEVDAALRRLHRQRGVTLVPEANQKTLDGRTRAAAVVIGDQAKHAIAMGDS